MAKVLDRIEKRIGDLRLSSPDEVADLFKERRIEFEKELTASRDVSSLEALKAKWVGRGARSIKRRVLDNWLKPESAFKREIGKGFRDLFAEDADIEGRLKQQRQQLEEPLQE